MAAEGDAPLALTLQLRPRDLCDPKALEVKLGTENDLFSLDCPREENSGWGCVCVHSFIKYYSG